jgi:hypothetical protein
MHVGERETLEAHERGGRGVRSSSSLAAPQARGSESLARALGRSRQPVDPREDAFDVALGNVALETVGRAAQGQGLVEGDQALLAQGQPYTFLPHITIERIGTDNKRPISASGRRNLAPARLVS